uniref:Uncharacterized protein n=1 Tax=viral metagenome TaxID=1070528 RepID=A0A6C0ELW1_9ZZZZ
MNHFNQMSLYLLDHDVTVNLSAILYIQKINNAWGTDTYSIAFTNNELQSSIVKILYENRENRDQDYQKIMTALTGKTKTTTRFFTRKDFPSAVSMDIY